MFDLDVIFEWFRSEDGSNRHRNASLGVGLLPSFAPRLTLRKIPQGEFAPYPGWLHPKTFLRRDCAATEETTAQDEVADQGTEFELQV